MSGAGGRPETLVIGLGNELRGDDGAGLLAAREIDARAPARLGVIEHQGEPVSLLDLWEGSERVVIVDAVDGGAGSEPGRIHSFDAAAGPLPAIFGGPSTHALGLAETIELARALGRLPASLLVLAVEGQRFETGTGPSAAVRDATSRVADIALAEVAEVGIEDGH